MSLIIGATGAALLLIGWIIETYYTITAKKHELGLHISTMFFVGTVLLTVYSWMRGDPVFLFLNAAIAVFEFIYIGSFFVKRRRAARHY